jgi:hypothetical protein
MSADKIAPLFGGGGGKGVGGWEQIVLVNRPYPLLIKLSMSHIFCSTPGVRAFLMPK